jgi:hypothetical protein
MEIVCRHSSYRQAKSFMRKTRDAKNAEEIEESFHRLAEEWKSETAPLSSIRRKKQHPAYGKLVAMGEPVMPLILADLARKPSHLFLVLRDITNRNPANPAVAENVLDVIDCWIEWGRAPGVRRVKEGIQRHCPKQDSTVQLLLLAGSLLADSGLMRAAVRR